MSGWLYNYNITKPVSNRRYKKFQRKLGRHQRKMSRSTSIVRRRGTPLYKMLRHRRAIEYKLKDTTLDTTSPGEVVWLTGLVNSVRLGADTIGSGNITGGGVVGDRATVCSISFKLVFLNPGSALNHNADPSILRLMIVQDTNYNQTVPGNWGANGFAAGVTVTPPFAITDVLETDSATSMVNFMNRSRFRILYDRPVTVTAQTGEGADGAGVGPARKFVSHNFACSINIEAPWAGTYADASPAAQQFGKNQLYMVFTDNQGGAGPCSIEHGTVRVRYSDE